MSEENKKIEAFVYLWQDAREKPYRYYLGYHKGHPDDGYTHSSTVFESFNKDNIPTGVKRRILATGTAEEMMELENKLLNNRKDNKWERYYNVIANFPQDMWEDPEYRKMKSKKASEQWKDPEFREMKSKQVSEKWKDPEFHEIQSKKMSEWNKKKWKDPEYRKMQAKNTKHLSVKIACNVCGVVSNRGNITRWHNDNCKHKKIENKQ